MGNDSVLNLSNKLVSSVPPAFWVIFLCSSVFQPYVFCVLLQFSPMVYQFLACLNFTQSVAFLVLFTIFVNSIFRSFLNSAVCHGSSFFQICTILFGMCSLSMLIKEVFKLVAIVFYIFLFITFIPVMGPNHVVHFFEICMFIHLNVSQIRVSFRSFKIQVHAYSARIICYAPIHIVVIGPRIAGNLKFKDRPRFTLQCDCKFRYYNSTMTY